MPMKSGEYWVRTPNHEPLKAYLQVGEDSITVYESKPDGTYGVPTSLSNNSVMIDRSFDFDALSIPFKLRPTKANFPHQLNSDFNGNFFLGFRSDRYRTQLVKTPAGIQKDIRHKAYTVGAFAGLGTTFVSPWTTDYRSTDEYQGFILSRGVSAMAGFNNLTVGVGIGWDYLTDRDKDIWIYQNKAWYGVTISLNLN